MDSRGSRRRRDSCVAGIIASKRAWAFDLDGVLIDTERIHFLAHQVALREFGVTIDRQFYVTHGVSTDPRNFYSLALATGQRSPGQVDAIVARKNEIYADLRTRLGVAPIRAAVQIVEILHGRGTPLAVVSTVPRGEIDEALRKLGILTAFGVIVSGSDDVPRNKPHPDVYLKATNLLATPPSESVAIEDSANGVRAATLAGLACIATPNSFTSRQDFSGAILVASSRQLLDMLTKGRGC